MLPIINIKGQILSLSPSQSIGKGGEADIFDIGQGKVLKLFKMPNHPDYQGQPLEQQGAQFRLQEHQIKLPRFPQSLPSQVISPLDLAQDPSTYQIVGYTMKKVSNATALIRYSDRNFRQTGISQAQVRDLFLDLYDTVDALHQAKVIVGDFNDLNILVAGPSAYLIDADSFQFDSFSCRVFTAAFTDPLLCDPKAPTLKPIQAFSTLSDWYAFTVMLMRSLLFVGPYGGVYRPQNPQKKLSHELRPLHRITIFNPEVRYPKPALPYDSLPDELLHYFYQVFERDWRDVWPRDLLENLSWTTCLNCGGEHARSSCPYCHQPGPTTQTLVIKGSITATQVFVTDGIILTLSLYHNQPIWLYHESGQFKRETQHTILEGDLDPHVQFRLLGSTTLLRKQNQVICLGPDKSPQRFLVDQCGSWGSFDTYAETFVWCHDGLLWYWGQLGSELVGSCLPGQTRIWTGPLFGFGYYRAGLLSIAFIFGLSSHSLNDQIKLPIWPGQWTDSICYFSHHYCWFFVATHHQGRMKHFCSVFRPDGSLVAQAEGERDDGSWLGSLSGHCAVDNYLLSATDNGIVKINYHQKQLHTTKIFADTEPFVSTHCQLLPSSEGLYVAGSKSIYLLRLN